MSFYDPRSWFSKPPKTTTPKSESPFKPVPTGTSPLAGKMPQFSDPVLRLNRKAYELIRRTDVIAQPMNKKARRIGMMTPVVVGRGKRCEQLQEIIDQTRGMPDALEYLAWAEPEGWRGIWINGYAVESRGFVAPDLLGGGIDRYQVGGVAVWDGWTEDNIARVEQSAQPDSDKASAALVDRSRVILFRPGAGMSPEGDTDKAWQLYLIAEAASLLDKAQRVYAERHSIPREILKQMTDALRPDEFQSVLQSAADKLAAVNAYNISAMSSEQILEYLEPSGMTWQFLVEYRRQLESRASKILLDEDTTGNSAATGPAVSSKNSQMQLEVAALSLAKKLCEPLTHDLLGWIEKTNSGYLARLKSDEPIPYIQLRPGVEKVRVTVAEAAQMLDRGWRMPSAYIAELMGHEVPPGTPEVFEKKAEEPKMPGDGVQATDENGAPKRQDKSPDVPGQEPKQQPNNDLRNATK